MNSVRNDTSLYYLLSNNYINEILMHPHEFMTVCAVNDATSNTTGIKSADEENLRDQYVSFMKSLSLRLDEKTVQFFFIEETKAFPLLTNAIKLLSYEEPMVRIAAQTTVLNIYKVSDSRSREYALRDSILEKLCMTISKLSNEKVCHIKNLIIDQSRLVRIYLNLLFLLTIHFVFSFHFISFHSISFDVL